MKVILRKDVDNLGEKDAAVEVADGYARNYLIPRGLAVMATDEEMKQLQEKRRIEEQKAEKRRQLAQELSEKVDGQTVTIRAKTGENERLFGSITTSDVSSALYETSGVEIDSSKIELEDNIRELGTYHVPIRLYEDTKATIRVQVVEG